MRDHGPGFDLADVPQDRWGVRESILGRMSRHGGSARVRRLEHGTEISISLPVSAVSSPVAHPDSGTQTEVAAQTGTTSQPDS